MLDRITTYGAQRTGAGAAATRPSSGRLVSKVPFFSTRTG
jgi:hypothetical protein